MTLSARIGRRAALTLIAGAALAGARPLRAAVPSLPRRLSFTAEREGSDIGTHSVSFERDGDLLTVTSEAELTLKFGPITVYRYRYRAVETWRGDRFEQLSSRTDDDGKEEHAEARLVDGQLVVTGSKSGRYVAPAGAIAATHWNAAELSRPMINPQHGELMRFERRDLGPEQLPFGVTARHYALTGYATLDLWYDEDGLWRALRAVAKDGSIINYRPN